MDNLGHEVADNVVLESIVSRVDWTGESVVVATTDGQRHAAELALP